MLHTVKLVIRGKHNQASLNTSFGLCIVLYNRKKVKLDVYGKRQTAKIKLLQSVFSSLYIRIKRFVFAVNSMRHFSIFV